MKIWIRSYIYQFTLTRLSIFTVHDWCHSPAVGSRQLQAVGIGKGFGITGHRTDLMYGLFMVYKRMVFAMRRD